jgi:hypothetical protein
VPEKYTEEQVTQGLMALIAAAGSAPTAAKYLQNEKKLEITADALNGLRRRNGARYDEMREKYRGQLEANLVHENRDLARLAIEGQLEAVAKARAMLASGQDRDPARTAANLSRVSAAATDKMLSVSGRPSQITEQRGLQEVLRSLAAKGVLQLPKETMEATEVIEASPTTSTPNDE